MTADNPPARPAPPGLESVAAAAEAAIGEEGAAPGAPPPGPDRAAELGAVLQMTVAILAPALPFVRECYPDETCQQIGAALAAVADKRGWNLDVINSPELVLLVVAGPPTVRAVIAGREHFAQQRAAAEAAERAARAARGARMGGVPLQPVTDIPAHGG